MTRIKKTTPVKKVPKKTLKLTRPNFMSFVAYTLMLFFGATIIMNINPDANSDYRRDWEMRNGKGPMQWIFLADDGQSYNLESVNQGEHAAADTFDYLLPNKAPITEVSDIGSTDEKTKKGNQDLNIELIDESKIAFPTKKAYSALRNKIEDRSVFINAVFEYLVRGDIVELPEGAVRYVVALYGLEKQVQQQVFEGKMCMTPWNYTIEDGDSVLAYEQRADAPFICNIQRRSCKNGKLSGSFVQSSCDETKNGNTKKINFETYHNPTTPGEDIQGNLAEQEARKNYLKENGYIMPDTPAYAGAEFNLQGKREPYRDPITIAEPLGDTSRDETEKPLINEGKKFCISPRGERVKAGQFVKAYRFKNGFTDIPCQVQLRLCVSGELEGTYQQPNCKPRDTSFEDFRNGYLNGEKPSIQRLLKMLEKDYSTEDTVSELDDTTAMQMVQALEEEM